METREELEKMISSINTVLVSDRVKLDQNVFIERHLPTIVKNGNLPTKDIQAELIKLAGNDIKVIDLIDESGNVTISLPPAIGSSKTISNQGGKLAGLNRTFSDLAESIRMGNTEAAQQKLKTVLTENKKDIIEAISENPWERIVSHFNKDGKIKQTQPHKKETISFDYD